MQIRLTTRDASVHLQVTVNDPEATVADLGKDLGTEGLPLVIDGRMTIPGDRLDRAGFGEGSVVTLGTLGTLGAAPAAFTLTVASGFDTGRQVTVPVGRWVIGRSHRRWRRHPPVLLAIEDPRVAPAHVGVAADDPARGRARALPGATVTLVAHVGASTERPVGRLRRLVTGVGHCFTGRRGRATLPGWNALPVDSVDSVDAATELELGDGTELALGPVRVALHQPVPAPPVLPPARGSTTRPLHRRPRAPIPPDPTPIDLPSPPGAAPAVTPVGVLGVVASIAMGAAMVVLLHSWAYAAFALLGPVLLVANALDSRRRRRRATRSGARRRQHDLTRLAEDLAEAADGERQRRQRLHPGPVDLLDRCAGPAPSCWERRATDVDAFAVRFGTGVGPWSPPTRRSAEDAPDDVAAVLGDHRTIPDIALGGCLDPHAPLAIVGPRGAALALARSVVLQAVVDHGPVDLGLAVLTDLERVDDWRWTTWLAHARQPDREPLLGANPFTADAVAARLLAPHAGVGFRRTLVVIDDPDGLAARRSGARAILRAAADPERGLVPLVLVPHPVDVPAVCAVVLGVDDEGRLHGPPDVVAGPAELVGVGRSTADEVARRLARLDDPELEDAGGTLPSEVGLAPMLATDPFDAHTVAAVWRNGGADPAPVAAIGLAGDGPLVIDLAADGPHVLVAGTTGSGKSELLRTLVTSLALASSPEHLTFVLVDFKGGSAFDACARLPHTTGVVTDLDDHLAGRALRCLEAELRYREQRLRDVGAADLTAFRATAPGDPLPRLVVVVDEFATLAAELPDFVDALVGIAQRGRSLGVHLVLATQRPAGAVSDNIRANTGLRIALRVQDGADSRDVIDTPAAAALPRQRPGRALARLGPGELVTFQAARVTGSTAEQGPVTVTAAPFGCALPRTAPGTREPRMGNSPTTTDLSRMADATAKAWAELGGAPPRRPWPDPLPEQVSPHHPLLAVASDPVTGPPHVSLGLADDPDHQRHVTHSWDLDAGPLLAVGLPGSGTTTAMAAAVLNAAERWRADQLHVHVIDLGAGELRPLALLSQVGAVVAGDDHERQRRLIAGLAADLAARRAAPEPSARLRRLLVIDGLAGFRASWDDVEPTGTWGHLLDLLAHGPAAGIAVALTASGTHAVAHRVLSACPQRLVFRLAERSDAAAFGISPASVPALPPGRAIAEGGRLVQVTWPGPDLAVAVAARKATGLADPGDDTDRHCVGSAHRSRRSRPDPVAVLPADLSWSEVPTPHGCVGTDGSLSLVLGLADAGLVPARLELTPGGHALVVGPPRSGRTTALRTLAVAAHRAMSVSLVVVTPSPATWSSSRGPVVHPDDPELEALVSDDRVGPDAPLLILVDDGDRTLDDHPVLARLVAERRPHRHLIAGARADRVRGGYGHWLREVQADRTGLLLYPDLDLDGDLLGVRLPRHPALPLRAGRGWLVSAGPAALCQVVNESH